MFTPTTQQLQIRFSNLPNHLQELIFDEKESDIIDGIGQESGFSLEKKEQLAHITLMVLTGFVSTTDIPKILMEALGIERVEAEKISGKLHDRIFTFVKNELAAVYKPEFSDDEIKKEEALEVTSSVSKETVSLENQESTPAFSLESLAPLELDLRQSTHPEAVQSTEKEPVTASTVPLPEPPKPVEAPVILHTESEIQPITFDLQDAELKAPELSIQNQSTEPEQATVQLGSAYIPTDTVPLPEPPKPEPEKNDLGIDKKNAVEFTPQLIKNAETVETIQTTTETNTGTDFIDLSTLTGETKLQAWFFLYGSGRNGKSVFSEIISRLMDSYGTKIRTESIMAKEHNSENANPDIAKLKGKRLVIASEISDAHRLNESLIKDLTGGDKISARFLNRNPIEFSPQCKLFMYGNHKPFVRGTDDGIWRRIKLIPFKYTIPENAVDPLLIEKLTKELSGILNWCLAGLKELQEQNYLINEPDIIKDETKAYRSEMDVIGQFLEEYNYTIDSMLKIECKTVYDEYIEYCKSNGFSSLSHRRVSDYLKGRNIHSEAGSRNVKFYKGLGKN
jgi:P4 family phage/plasmid primase-like protien